MFILRRVAGDSMYPTLLSRQIVIGTKFIKPASGRIIIFDHMGREKIKRVVSIKGKNIHVIGDNQRASEDSRSFGPINFADVKAVVIWPRHVKQAR